MNDGMTSNRPYLVRALYEWVTDNGMTPHVLVDADVTGVDVPREAIQNGKIILNIAPSAVGGIELGNDWISLTTRFSGQSRAISFPVGAVIAIYARENGQGMMFAEKDGSPPDGPDKPKSTVEDLPTPKAPHLKVIK